MSTADCEAAAVQAVAEALRLHLDGTEADLSDVGMCPRCAEVAVAAAWPHIAGAVEDAITAERAKTIAEGQRLGLLNAARIARSTKPTGETP